MSSGIVFGGILDGSGGGTPCESFETRELAAGETLWLHLDYQDEVAQDWLLKSAGIEPIAAAALLDDDTRPRVVEFTTGLLANLRGVNLNAGAKPEEMVSVRIWLEPQRIITTRRRMMRSPRELFEMLPTGGGPRGSGDFLVRLAERLDVHIAPVIDGVEAEIEDAELRYSGTKDATYRGEFGALRRKTARLRRYLAPQRDTLERLARLQSPLLNDAQRNRLREEADTVNRHLEDLDLSRERATVAQEELLNRMAQTQNSRMYVLSIVAAIFLPLSFLTGLLGMNVAGLPGTQSQSAFAVAVLVMIGIGAGIVVFFRWRKWM